MALPSLSPDDLLRTLADVHTEAELRARLSELSDPENPGSLPRPPSNGPPSRTKEGPRG